MRQGFTMAEIGVWGGESVIGYVDMLKRNNGFLYLVDWFMGNPTAAGPHALRTSKANDAKGRLLKVVKGVRHQLLEGESKDMIPLIPDGMLDLAYIDADHRYSGVKSDIELLIPKIKRGGILCGHDFEAGALNLLDEFTPEELEQDMARGFHAGVAKALYDIFGMNKIRTLPDCMWFTYLL